LFIRTDADKNPDLFGIFQGLVNGIKPTRIEITYEHIEKPGILDKGPESFLQISVFLVSNKGQV